VAFLEPVNVKMADDNKKVEETEEKPKSLIDRFWWVIPPVFLTFIYHPLFLAISGHSYYLLSSTWHEAMLKSIRREFSVMWFENIRRLFSLKYEGGLLVPLFMFGFMGIGFIITKKMSLKYKILIPSILGAIGLRIGFYAALYYYPEPF